MRDRLSEMIQSAVGGCAKNWADVIADHLLSEGIVVPPCKVGDKLYNKDSLIDDCCYWEIVKFEIYADECGVVDDSGNWHSFEDIGKTVFLTRELADKALERSKK